MNAQQIENYKKWQPLLLGLVAALGMWAGLNIRMPAAISDGNEVQPQSGYSSSQKLTDVISYIQSKYVDSLGSAELTDLTLHKLLQSLDPYSEYIPANYMPLYSDALSGQQVLYGLECTVIDSQVVVRQILPGSPAALLGLQTGDFLMQINEMHFPEDRYAFMDSMGLHAFRKTDSVNIRWYNRSKNKMEAGVLLPKVMLDNPVSAVHSPMKSTVYVKLREFTKDSYRHFMEVLEEFEGRQGCTNLIIDLRGNGGGLLIEAAHILNQLVEEKDLLLFKTQGYQQKEKEYRSTGKNFFQTKHIVIFVDRNTASAAELLAATLQDLDRALIIGEQSFGKSTILEQFDLADGSAIRLSMSRFLTHSGRSIQRSYESQDSVSEYYLMNPVPMDQKNYFSRLKKKLPSNQGVVPDIILDNTRQQMDCKDSLQKLAEKIIIRRIVDFRNLVGTDPDKIRTSKELEKWILEEGQGVAALLPPQCTLEDLKQECQYALCSWLFGKELEQRARLLKDPCMEKALSYLNAK